MSKRAQKRRQLKVVDKAPVEGESTPGVQENPIASEEVQAILDESQSPEEAAEMLEELPVAKKKLPPRYAKKDWKDDDIITVLRPNPKRGAAAERYELYESGLTVAEFVKKATDAGVSKADANADLRWDAFPGRKGGPNISIAPASEPKGE